MTNAKRPTLTGYAMRGLWAEAQAEAGRIGLAEHDVRNYRQKYKAFRQKWGNKTPRSVEEWTEFWHEFWSLEDGLDDIEGDLSQAARAMTANAASGMEIVKANGFDGQELDVLAVMRDALKRAEDLVNE